MIGSRPGDGDTRAISRTKFNLAETTSPARQQICSFPVVFERH